VSELFVPDRFERLREVGSGALRTIVAPVTTSLEVIDRRFVEIRAARRGALMILHGASGAGKSTFLETVGMFRHGVVTERIDAAEDIRGMFTTLEPTSQPRILVLEGREALREVPESALEEGMHALNAFVRSPAGQETLVVWPTNTDELKDALVNLGERLGAEALFGTGERIEPFVGPSKEEYVGIATRTVAALNEGASLAALGVTEEYAEELASKCKTIGRYLALIRDALVRNGAHVRELLAAEQCRMWTAVLAAPDAEGDVAALTRGGYGAIDIDRLMTATGANIVQELKEHPDQLGILGTVLDARILYIDMVTALAVAREYGDQQLHELMRGEEMTVAGDGSASERLAGSELGVLLTGGSLGTRKRGPKPGSNTQRAFASLTKIARTNDIACNRAFGTGLVSVGLVESFETERDLGAGLARRSDLYCVQAAGPIRIEFMWRGQGGRATIANYVLTKLGSYSKAIGLLK
jgi:hypothetical protein